MGNEESDERGEIICSEMKMIVLMTAMNLAAIGCWLLEEPPIRVLVNLEQEDYIHLFFELIMFKVSANKRAFCNTLFSRLKNFFKQIIRVNK